MTTLFRTIGKLLPEFMKAELRAFRAREALKRTDPEVKLLPALAGDGVFVDVGANLGNWSAPAARLFHEVHAFEPDPKHAKILRRNLPSNVIVHPFALSNYVGTAEFHIPIFNGGELITRASLELTANVGFSEVVREVRLTTLDNMGLTNIDAIKIDVEGHEASVLDGAEKSIDRDRPSLIVEIEDRHHPNLSKEIFDRLLCRDYLCYFIWDRQLEPFTIHILSKIQPIGGANKIGSKPASYVNNFIFFPKERQHKIEFAQKLLRPV